MLYSQYTKRMTRLAAFFKFLRRYRIPILITLFIVLATVATLLGTRGLVYDNVACPSTIEYGSAFEYRAGAFMDDVRYEFRAEGSDEWTETQPIRVGKYYVRAVSSRTFGGTSYGKVYEFTIAPKPLDINVAPTVVYGETPEVSASTVYGDTVVCAAVEYDDISRQATKVRAKLDSVTVFDVNGDDVTSSYALRAPESDMVFIAREIEITVESVSFVYDGTPHSSSAWELSGGALASGDIIVPVFDKSQTDAGEIENTPQINVEHRILNDAGIDVTANYSIRKNAGKLTVQKRTVIIETADAQRVYDGTPFTCDDYTIADDTPLADGHRLEVASDVFRIDVGARDNTLGFKAYDGNGAEVTANYNFIVNEGIIEVTPRPLGINTSSARKEYDGTPLSNPAYEIASGTSLVPGHSVRVLTTTSITDAGEASNAISVCVKAADGETDLTFNYEITYAPGTLTVTPRPLTVTTYDQDTYVYDGNVHATDNITCEGLLTELGHDFAVTMLTAQTDATVDENGEVISIPNAVEIEIVGTLASNYAITYNYGVIVIHPRPLFIDTPDGVWTYDGEYHDNSAWSKSQNGVYDAADGESIIVASNTRIKDVVKNENGEVVGIPNILTFGIENGKPENYKLNVTVGTLKILPRNVTLQSDHKQWTYDGNEHYWEYYTVVSELGFVEQNAIEIDSHTSIKDVCSVENVLTHRFADALPDNYIVEWAVGNNIEVVKRNVKIATVSDGDGVGFNAKWVYNGEPYSNPTWYIATDSPYGFAKDHILEVVSYTEVTDVKMERGENGDKTVGTYDNVAEFKLVGSGIDAPDDADGNYAKMLANYDFEYTYGALTVNPREVKIQTSSNGSGENGQDRWEYDGKPHSDNRWKIADDSPYGFAKDHNFEILLHWVVKDVKVSGIDDNGKYIIGSYDNEIIFKLVGADIDSDRQSENYNYEQMLFNYNFLDCKFGTNGEEYYIVCSTGKLTVLPIDIHITTYSNGSGENGEDKWIYDGKTHTEKRFTADRQPISGEQFTVPVATAIYRVGTVDNKLRLGVWDGKFSPGVEYDYDNKTHNYEFTYTYGTLTMLHREVDVKIHSSDKVYDDKPLSCAEYTVTSDIKFVEGESIEAVKPPSITDVGEIDNKFELKVTGYMVDGITPDDVTDNYIINYTYGKLRVDPRTIIVQTPTVSLVYNGKQQSALDASIASDSPYGLADGHEFVVDTSKAYASRTEVGSEQNSFEERIVKSGSARAWTADDDKTNNYAITYRYGTLTILPRAIKVKAASKEKMYDGLPLRADSVEVLNVDDKTLFGLADGHTAFIACTGEQTDVGTCDNLFVAHDLVIKDANDVEVTSNYSITYIDEAGELKVTPRTVSVLTDSDEKVFDGDPLIKDCFTVTSQIDFVKGQTTVIRNAPSITDAGEIDNIFDIAVFDGARDVTFNYAIDYTYGKLKITPRRVTVVTNSNEWTYDGNAHFDEGWSVADDSPYGFVKDHTLRVDGHTEIKNAGSLPNELTLTLINTAPVNYEITIVNGTLTVNKRRITVTTPDMEKVYDGTPLVGNGNSITDNLVPGHIVYFNQNVRQQSVTDVTDEGSNYVEVAYIFDENTHILDDYIVTDNYEVEYIYGALTITPRPITVLTASNEWVYDGIAHYDDGFSIVEGTLVDGQSAIVSRYPTITDPGEIENELELDIVVGNSYKTINYLIRYNYGTLIVTAAPDDPDIPEGETFMRVMTDKDTTLYLRETSRGDYTGSVNWSAAPEYTRNKINYNGKNYSVNYLPNVIMQNGGFETANTDVEMLIDYYVVPYFATFADGNAVQTSDVGYSGEDREYSFEHYSYMYAADNGAALGAKNLGIYANIEKDYRAFVYANYLSVPEDTARYMQSVIDERKFNKADVDVIKKVARYIQSAAKYNKKYDSELDSSTDVAVSFLKDYKEGICVHYATAATVMFRTLGIPARYTLGVMTPVKAGEWTEVKEGHAWVEVYIDGVGWMPVEVTGGNGDGSGGGSGEGSGDGSGSGDGQGGPGEMKEEITVKPKSVEYVYDGAAHYAPNEVESEDGKFEALIESGFSYIAEISGSRTDVGSSESLVVRFALYNEEGRNVTDNYVWNFEPGIIRIVNSPIYLSTFKLSKQYDGTPLKFEELIPGMGILLPSVLPDGVARVDIDYERFDGITEVGTIDCIELAMLFEELGLVRITSTSGADVTANYSIVLNEGSLTVARRKITIATKNATKKYDGTPLEGEAPEVVKGSLVEGHSLKVVTMTSITEITDAPVPCMFACKVVDSDGNDVSDQYDISYNYGLLNVTP